MASLRRRDDAVPGSAAEPAANEAPRPAHRPEGWLIGFLVVALLTRMALDAGRNERNGGSLVLLIIVQWMLKYLVASVAFGLTLMVVHEAGHLLAGWLVGFHFHSVRVGRFLI